MLHSFVDQMLRLLRQPLALRVLPLLLAILVSTYLLGYRAGQLACTNPTQSIHRIPLHHGTNLQPPPYPSLPLPCSQAHANLISRPSQLLLSFDHGTTPLVQHPAPPPTSCHHPSLPCAIRCGPLYRWGVIQPVSSRRRWRRDGRLASLLMRRSSLPPHASKRGVPAAPLTHSACMGFQRASI